MNPVLRHTYNLFRTIVVTAIVSVIVLYAAVYILLCIPSIQQKIKAEGEKQLSEFLKTKVTIGNLSIKPFNQIILSDVNIPDQQNNDLFKIETVGAGINITKLLVDRKIEITYAEVIGLHGHITRPDKNSPTNMQFIIDAFKPKGKKPPTKFDLAIHDVVIRNTDVTYDVLSEPRKINQFDQNHIGVTDLRADIEIPRLKNDDFNIEIKRLSAKEKSGLHIVNFSADAVIKAQSTTLSNIKIELPGTYIVPNDQSVEYDSLKHIGTALKNKPLDLAIINAKITPSDFKCFLPGLKVYNQPFDVSATVLGDLEELRIPVLKVLSSNRQLVVDVNGVLRHVKDKTQLSFNIPHFKVEATSSEINKVTSNLVKLAPNVQSIVNKCGSVKAEGKVNGNLNAIDFVGNVSTAMGNVKADVKFKKNPNGEMDFDGHVETPQFNVGGLINKSDLIGSVSMDVDAKVALRNNQLLSATINGKVNYIDLKGYRYHNITADITGNPKSFAGKVKMDDPNGHIDVQGNALLAGVNTKVDLDVIAQNVNLARLNLYKGAENVFSGNLKATFTGNSLDNANGQVFVDDLTYSTANGKTYHLNNLSVSANNSSYPQNVNIQSDFINGSINGKFDFNTIVPSVKCILSSTFPELFGEYSDFALENSKNNFNFNFVVEPNEHFTNLVKLPVKLLYKATIDGHFNAPEKDFDVSVSVPYIQQGKNLIEGTSLTASYDDFSHSLIGKAQTLIPSKNGKIAVAINAVGANNRINTDIGWRFNRQRDYHGNILTSTHLIKTPGNPIEAHVDVNPSQIVVNDTVWYVGQGSVEYANGVISVDSINGNREGQYIIIDGKASKNPDDELVLNLKNIDLDYIFDVLNINNVTFGGRATGLFYASDLFTKSPKLRTPNLHVDNLAYNHANMGNADIECHWENDTKAIVMNADLSQQNGEHSKIIGEIFPTKDSLYIDFNAKRANVKFMKPFMAAFTSDIAGEVSGHAVLYGNFHTIDLYGDIFVNDLKFKLDFSNVYYYCKGDSVHMKPGIITFNNVKLYDRDNHQAMMNGWLRHKQFHSPVFNFSITEAKELLCYDTNSSINPVWYGTIYGNGSAFVSGEPGLVNIKVNMESAPRSKFTFVLSDNQVANEYKFITYRDRDVMNAPPVDTVSAADTLPEFVKQFQQKIKNADAPSAPTKYMIDLQGDITPDMQMTLVMDPIGGDKIRATGHGSLKMKYDNTDEVLEMYGKYILEKGSYNFTLQDIIIKDFSIKEGSTISFQGDPYKAILDIEAIYSLNANIKDLDQSFAEDRELNRTSVPVHALLKANGVISQPDISFDLEFPTLTSEAYRKIKSIISTDDMMNRQIVYLLALNRFYTPDYMNNTTSNNELSSIASSTISSQLSNMLGQINENWSISPNFRSEKGDFSDTEFDLALSSQLLNNRLLFNGNFGYRDNTYNTKNSNFIGDFDIEYLLNAKGTWRLKAYNHFNDQNLYVRNAMTTQGVGIVFKHDFDHLFDFLHKKPAISLTDSTSVKSSAPADTLNVK